VSSDSHLAAAHVFICDRDTSHNWQIYFDKSSSPLKPNQAITAHAVETFRSRGLKYLNLGATPPDAVGVSQYKQKWGGREYAYQVFEFRSWLGRVLP
jgi:CelD/BcsL family acetyltransferase involved in cellulose biosynthesis